MVCLFHSLLQSFYRFSLSFYRFRHFFIDSGLFLSTPHSPLHCSNLFIDSPSLFIDFAIFLSIPIFFYRFPLLLSQTKKAPTLKRQSFFLCILIHFHVLISFPWMDLRAEHIPLDFFCFDKVREDVFA